MKTSSISKLNGHISAILSLSLLALAAPACMADASDGDEPSAPSSAALSASADTGLANEASKPASVRPAIPPGVATGEDLPAKPLRSSKAQAVSSPHNFAWGVGLFAAPTSLWPTQYTTLNAVANGDVGPTPYYLRIKDENTGAFVASCSTGPVCSVPMTQSGYSTRQYKAYIQRADGSDVVASSNAVWVDWHPAFVDLSASTTTAALGASTTLTASTDYDVTSSPFFTRIFDVTTGALLRSCGSGTSCGVTVSQTGASTHAYQAVISQFSTSPQLDYKESTATNYVTWASTGLSISLSKPVSAGGLNQTVAATASIDVGPTPYFIEIFNEATGAQIKVCSSTSACTVTYQGSAAPFPLVAFIASSSTKTLPASGVEASSNVVHSIGIIG